uniref:Uncharacterized protein n=1 Tax=Arundo donax TaxID=35708 RepID=A0A0A8ZN08_ARUDO
MLDPPLPTATYTSSALVPDASPGTPCGGRSSGSNSSISHVLPLLLLPGTPAASSASAALPT